MVADGTADAGDEFKLSIRQSGAAVEVLDNLSVNPDALNFAENVVNARSRLVRIAVAKANDSDVAGTSIERRHASDLPTGRPAPAADRRQRRRAADDHPGGSGDHRRGDRRGATERRAGADPAARQHAGRHVHQLHGDVLRAASTC